MRARTLLTITLGAALAAAAVLATVAPASAAPTKKGQTVVTLDSTAAGVITGLGVAVAPTGPASASGLAFTFPVVGRTGDAVIQHVGGLSLTAGETVVTLSNFWIDTDSGVVTGVVDDTVRVPLFTLGDATDDGAGARADRDRRELPERRVRRRRLQRGPGHRLRRARRER